MLVETTHKDQRQAIMRFVVVADTHVNESEAGGSSPFITNASANARARYVFNEIAAMQPAPEFVIHLGDIVHPVPSLPSFQQAVDHFKKIAAPLSMPLHVLPGNHDVGDKHIDWMPADLICDEYLATYRDAFGADYFAFDHGNLRFVMLNSVLFNSGLADDQRQRDWFIEQLDSAAGKRVFVSMHYPPYIHTADERGNYDNIDQPARAWLLEQLARPEVEAIFAGHVHNFWYDRVGNADMYLLPSTAFLRHDFSEFYRVTPKVEFARGDPERYGYFLVEVFEDGHVAYSIRTMGAQTAADAPALVRSSVTLAHPKSSALRRVGVELRHPWAETMQITATGGVQEFGRKWARNDYPLQAFWEMGARLAKVPDIDLAEPQTAHRMALLAAAGSNFIVTCLGKPNAALLDLELATCGVQGFEVNATIETFARQQSQLKSIRSSSKSKIYFAKILSADHSRYDGAQFTHFVKSGFALSELQSHRSLIEDAVNNAAIDGVTVHLSFDESLPEAAAIINELADSLACEVLVSLKLAGPSVAQARNDDRALAARTAQAMVFSQTNPRVCYVFDTFMDVDRGYYPRQAFIDRRFNPRTAAVVFTQLNARLSGLGPIVLDALDRQPAGAIGFSASGQSFELHCGPSSAVATRLKACSVAVVAMNLLDGSKASAKVVLSGLDEPLANNESDLQVVLLAL
ncbi:MAG: 3',5'-cyclic AMP phosphodiesterase CpdA [Gammaproteobacteria bacterium]